MLLIITTTINDKKILSENQGRGEISELGRTSNYEQ